LFVLRTSLGFIFQEARVINRENETSPFNFHFIRSTDVLPCSSRLLLYFPNLLWFFVKSTAFTYHGATVLVEAAFGYTLKGQTATWFCFPQIASFHSSSATTGISMGVDVWPGNFSSLPNISDIESLLFHLPIFALKQ
jgi:hypothetical protein